MNSRKSVPDRGFPSAVILELNALESGNPILYPIEHLKGLFSLAYAEGTLDPSQVDTRYPKLSKWLRNNGLSSRL